MGIFALGTCSGAHFNPAVTIAIVAAVAEIMFTFLLAFVVLSVATVEQPLSEYFGLAIGSCVTAGGYAIGAVSGGSLNPAVSFGISASHAIFGGGVGVLVNCVIYSIFEIIGGCIAAGVFMATHPSEYSKGSADEAAPVTADEPSA